MSDDASPDAPTSGSGTPADRGDPDAPIDPAGGAGDVTSERRVVRRLVAAVAALVFGILLLRYGDSDEDEAPSVASADEDDAAITVALGPPPGTTLSTYVPERRAALGPVEGRRVAVVSLTGYSSSDTVEELTDGLEVDSFLVAFVADEARRTEDVGRTRRSVADEARAQLEELEGLAPTVEDDPDYSSFYAREIERYRLLLDEIERDDVVHGFVVTGTVAELRALASRASVRLVDLGRSDVLARDAAVHALRPEETERAGEPMFRPS